MTNETVQARPRRRRWLRWWVIVLALLVGFLAWNYWPRQPEPVPIGRDTTFITGPLKPDGTVDYLAYLEERYGRGVTPENNAAPLLVRALGPTEMRGGEVAHLVSRLGLSKADMLAGPRFISWWDRSRQSAGASATAQAVSLADDLDAEEDADSTEWGSYELAERILQGQLHPDLESWLTANEPAFELAYKASKLTRYYVPPFSGSGVMCNSSPGTNLSGLRELGRFLCVRAAWHQHKGDLAAAWQDILVLHRIVRLFKQSPWVIDWVVVLSMDRMAAAAGVRLAQDAGMDAQMARAIIRDLEGLGPATGMRETLEHGSRILALYSLQCIHQGASIESIYLPQERVEYRGQVDVDWQAVFKRLNAAFDAAEFAPASIDIAEVPAFVGELRWYRWTGRLGRSHRTKMLGELFESWLPNARHLENIELGTVARFKLEKLAFALAAYRAQKGQYPDQLGDLSPGYLANVPDDPFGGKSFVYRRDGQGYILYSIGENMTDDGGVPGASKEDDIVVATPAQPAQNAATLPATGAGN